MNILKKAPAYFLCASSMLYVILLGTNMNHYQEEVLYRNDKADVALSGTLTLPSKEGVFPAVLLIAGYGAHDRDITHGEHKPFLVLAEYLTRRGIAVLRYDKRGAGKSTGLYVSATTRDFADDARAGIDYLKTRPEINPNKIGVIGLSEGGLIAAMLSAECPDIAFAVLMAPAVASDMTSWLDQTALQLRADGASQEFIDRDRQVRTSIYQLITQEPDTAKAEKEVQNILSEYLTSLPESQKIEAETLPFAFTPKKVDMLVKVFNSPWYRFFWSYNAADALRHITIPVLCVNGERDWIASPKTVFSRLQDGLTAAGNKDYTLVELPGLNHSFQTCKTGSIAEYGTIKETIAPIALKTIGDWVVAHI